MYDASSSFHTPLFLPGKNDWVWMHSSVCIGTFLFNPCQLAENHHNLSLLRRCTLGWQQSARESLGEKEASADQLYHHFLLRRGLNCWKRVCIHPQTQTHSWSIRIAVSIIYLWLSTTPFHYLLSYLHSIMFPILKPFSTLPLVKASTILIIWNTEKL